ncbi:MAG: signal peptidase II [Endomicrobium sp.]|jgi:signal peptidase II|nr:signal peptidase II [Endomicrobium sp.]
MKKPLILGILTLILDQFSKYLIVKNVDYASHINVIPIFDFFNITNIHNTGTAFSILQGRNAPLSLFISIFLSVLAAWLYKNKEKLDNLQKYSFCLVIFGGLGNLIDRFFKGAVVDFLDFGINSLRWPSFNVADSCVCVAMGLIAIDLLFFDGKKVEAR